MIKKNVVKKVSRLTWKKCRQKGISFYIIIKKCRQKGVSFPMQVMYMAVVEGNILLLFDGIKILPTW